MVFQIFNLLPKKSLLRIGFLMNIFSTLKPLKFIAKMLPCIRNEK